ncbi:MAG: hypothetical protein WAT79_00515, partial [Saprospiraceae bacterium]
MPRAGRASTFFIDKKVDKKSRPKKGDCEAPFVLESSFTLYLPDATLFLDSFIFRSIVYHWFPGGLFRYSDSSLTIASFLAE